MDSENSKINLKSVHFHKLEFLFKLQGSLEEFQLRRQQGQICVIYWTVKTIYRSTSQVVMSI